MTEESFEWCESDEKYTKYESENEQSFSSIYGVNCPECGDKLYNTGFSPDPDSPVWSYECKDCEIHVSLRPSKLVAVASDASL